MCKHEKIKNLLRFVAIPVAYALILRLFFGVNTWNDLFSVMSITFLFCVPTIVGALTVYFPPCRWAKWIMKDIQNNILQVEKARSENIMTRELQPAALYPGRGKLTGLKKVSSS